MALTNRNNRKERWGTESSFHDVSTFMVAEGRIALIYVWMYDIYHIIISDIANYEQESYAYLWYPSTERILLYVLGTVSIGLVCIHVHDYRSKVSFYAPIAARVEQQKRSWKDLFYYSYSNDG